MLAQSLREGQPIGVMRHQDHTLEIRTSLGTNIFFYLPFQARRTKIVQEGNKKWQHTSFADELQCPWDSWEHILTVTAAIKSALSNIFLKFIGKIIRSPVCLDYSHRVIGALIFCKTLHTGWLGNLPKVFINSEKI